MALWFDVPAGWTAGASGRSNLPDLGALGAAQRGHAQVGRPSTGSESLRVLRFEASGLFLTLHERRC